MKESGPQKESPKTLRDVVDYLQILANDELEDGDPIHSHTKGKTVGDILQSAKEGNFGPAANFLDSIIRSMDITKDLLPELKQVREKQRSKLLALRNTID